LTHVMVVFLRNGYEILECLQVVLHQPLGTHGAKLWSRFGGVHFDLRVLVSGLGFGHEFVFC
jgi:hypothetical protein